MRTLWFGVQWTGRKLVFLASLVAVTVALLMLPALSVDRGLRLDFGQYWSVVSFHLQHLIKGQLIPPPQNLGIREPIQSVPADLVTAIPATLKLLGTALLASSISGLGLGLLLSALAPRWLRSLLWGATTILYSLPDLLIATFLTTAILLISPGPRMAGLTPGMDLWQHFWAPAVALTLIVLPYIARVTATAIDEITGQVYIQAAVARGIHPAWILLKHVGKNVLIRVSTILPMVVSMLFSGGVVVEYLSEVHGVGRALIQSAAPQAQDRYAGVAYLLPMLVIFTAALGLSELIHRLLDPRIAPPGAGSGAAIPAARATRSGLPTLREMTSGLVSLGLWLRSIPAALGARLVGLPGRLRQALRDPVLLAGLLLVSGLLFVAVAAPWIAPFDPDAKIHGIIAPGGRILVPPFTPGKEHWLGTDDWGRDVLSQIIFGTRYALIFALLAVPARFLMAIPLGLMAAFRGGIWDKLIAWVATFFTAVPHVILPLVLLPTINVYFRNQPGMTLFLGVTLVGLPGAPRLAASIRAQAAEVLAQPFVEGAYAVGAGTARTLFRYVLPQMLPQLATMLALEIPSTMTLTALLGFFKAYPGGAIFDTQGWKPLAPWIPEWGSLMENPLVLLMAGRWWMWAPFVALSVAVLAFNLLGEGMRRTLASRTGWKWQG